MARTTTRLLRPALVAFLVALALVTPRSAGGDDGGPRTGPGPEGLEARAKSAVREVIAASVRIETEDGLGSGTIVDADGLVLTSAHVIEGCRRIEVTLTDGRRFLAQALGVNGGGDLALLRIPAVGLAAARFGDPSALARGDWVIAAGHPSSAFDDFQPTISIGRLRVLDGAIRATAEKSFRNVLVSDVPLSAGSSGGGLFDLEGRLVGVNAAVTTNERSAFTVRITEYLADADRLRRGERFDRVPTRRRSADWRDGRTRLSRENWFAESFPGPRREARARMVGIRTRDGEISGAIVGARGEIVTVARALGPVRRDELLSVTLPEGREVQARVVGCDLQNDVAVLALPERSGGYLAFDLAAAAPVGAGTLVMTPNPTGLDGGILASEGARRPPNELKGIGYLPDVLQCDLRLWADQLGAPVVDRDSRLVGIVVQHRLRRTEKTWQDAPFGAFVMPIERLRESLGAVRRFGDRAAPDAGYLGVELVDLTESEKAELGVSSGVLVRRVSRGRAGAQGGLRDGDVLLAIGGRPVASRGEAVRAIEVVRPGDPVVIEARRAGRDQRLEFPVGSRREPTGAARIAAVAR
ncbi:MAG: trypsin-like peptidase domain-containing protein [Planctomycetota bacterium]